MYYSITEARGTGSPVALAVPPYLDKAHIRVYVDGLQTTAFEWINPQAIQITAPLNALVRVVRRTSPEARLTIFENGQPLPGDTLEVDSKQAFYLAQEAYDLGILAGGTSGGTVPPGVELTTGGLLDLLNGQITPSLLETALRNKIELTVAPATVLGSPAWLVAQEAAARAGALQAEYEARVAAIATASNNAAAALASEATLRQDADGFLAAQVNTVAAGVDGANAAVQSEASARASGDASLASDIDTVVAYIDDLTFGDTGPLADRIAAVEVASSAHADRITGVEAQWTVKVQARSDGKQAIAGIGINATANDNVAQSEMVFLADKFVFVPSMAGINTVPQPLLVAGLVNGVNTIVVPPSRLGDQLIEARMVIDGAIETRHLKVTGGRGVALNDDPAFSDASAWTVNYSGTFLQLSDGKSGPSAFRTQIGGEADIYSRWLPTNPAKRYRVRCFARRSAAANGLLYTGLQFVDSAGTNIPGGGTFWYAGAVGSMPSTSWLEYVGEIQPPSNAVRMRVLALANYAGSAGYHDLQDLSVAEMLDASLIVAGGISADRIDTRLLTIKDAAGNVIFGAGSPLDVSRVTGLGSFAYVNAITAGNVSSYIAAAAIGSAQVGTLTAQNLTVGAVSDTINGGTSSGGRVAITTNSVRVYDAANVLRVKLGDLS